VHAATLLSLIVAVQIAWLATLSYAVARVLG